MQERKASKKYTVRISDSMPAIDDELAFEVPFRRWLVREIESGRLSTAEAIQRFNFNPATGPSLLNYWRKRYPPVVALHLPPMTAAERAQMEALQKQVKALEKQLDDARMKAIALDTLIDVAEEKLKIEIRKKAGTKQ